jgi:transposase-like protein
MKTMEQDRYGAAEKCRAVLAVWMERKKASVLCREMGVSASLLSQWQDRAVSGMLEALEPRGTRDGMEGPALPAQFKRLLDRKARARELQSLGRNVAWRSRPVKGRPAQETPPTAAVS